MQLSDTDTVFAFKQRAIVVLRPVRGAAALHAAAAFKVSDSGLHSITYRL